MRYLRLHTLGFAVLLVALTVIHCLPTEAQADRRRRWTTYGSDRGRLVVACDMRSDTCSDGRKITTQRATPVPCETSPGVWEMVPEDTGCYSVRGLESWAQTTTYLSYGAELDRSPWQVMLNNTLTPLPGGGYRVCHQEGASSNSGIRQYTGLEAGLTFTAAAVVRANTATHALLGLGNAYAANLPLPAEWGRISHTGITLGANPPLSLYPRPSGAGRCVDIIGFWVTTTDTPGRACWGGEAPVTCARDFHRMSATGFPATTGEISWVMSLERMPDGDAGLRGIVWADGAPVPNRISLTGNGGIRIYTGETAYTTGPLSWEPGRSYTFRLIMAEDEWKVVRDGALVGSTPPLGSMDWGATVRLGDLLDGSISSLRVRSFE